MRGLWKKMTAAALCAVTAVSTAACGAGGGSSASAENTYSVWLYSAQDASYYTDYSENPALQYVQSKTWGSEEKAVALEFLVPPSGSEQDNYQTMVASGEYPDVLMGAISDPAPILYENGIIMDLTDYVEEYMPNYTAFLEAHEDFRANVVYEIDGEEKILSITAANEDYPYYFCGPQYRRDWIVKYGTNPETGEAFTGGYTDPEDPDSWEDDVVFPSGGTEPVYISDWEWMFGIFTRAQADLGIEDSYSMSVYYPGFSWSGGLCSSFGGGVPVWYKNTDGEVVFGGDSEQMRAYLECLNTWYANGWLDQEFNERTSDSFYAIDDTSVRQGEVGLWVGSQGQLGGRMDLNDGGYTEGICSYGCAWPINDVYGTEECKYVEPDCVPATSLSGTPYFITTAAEGKDIATLCSFLDYFYSEEGALIRTLGLSGEQAAESGSSLYEEWGLADGAYSVGDDGRYIKSDVLVSDSGNLQIACNLEKLPGITLISSVDNGYADTYEASLASWLKYKNTGFFQGSAVTNNMTNEDAGVCDDIRTRVLDYMTIHAPEMITGATDPFDDGDWNTWSTMLQKYNYQKATEIYQPYADQYTF
ncbi:MAG: extracellular solute-binding protein [Eubacteriales bacterium]|nr:extracellular solute-binding protein [Eubacteriales bacterium]